MTRRANDRRHRGLTLIEMMMSLVITSLIASAIAVMLGAVTSGIVTRRDARSTMVAAHAAQSRLSAYVAPSRCVLSAEPERIVLWLNDSRQGDTVHATEIRWIEFVAAEQALDVHYIEFPEAWGQTARDLQDREHAAGSDFWTVLAGYDAKGLTATRRLVAGLDSVSIAVNGPTQQASDVCFSLDFDTQQGSRTVHVGAAIRLHAAPAK